MTNSATDILLYRCTECGETSTSLGRLHAHAERHRGFRGLQLPWRVGDYTDLMELTEVLRVCEVKEIDPGGDR